MKTNFTPPPWRIDDPKFEGKWSSLQFQGKCRGIYATNDDLEMIAFVPKDRLLQFKDQDHEANAHLISAAPDMFNVLYELYNDREVWSDLFPSQQESICQVLNKATNSNYFTI